MPIFRQGVTVVMAFDNRYALYGFATLYSVLDRAAPGTHFSFHILYEDGALSTGVIQKAKALFETERSTITFRDVSELFNKSNLYTQGYLTRAVYLRLAIPSLFRDHRYVIYLDSDILVRSDLSLLMSVMDEKAPLGAVPDILIKRDRGKEAYVPDICGGGTIAEYERSVLELKKPERYFNSGVLVFNIPKITKDHIEKSFALCRKNLQFPDQDILNAVFNEDVFLLDEGWNFFSVPPNWNIRLSFDPLIPPEWRKRYVDAYYHPHILHFIGSEKPWHNHDPRRPYFKEYQDNFRKMKAKLQTFEDTPETSPAPEKDIMTDLTEPETESQASASPASTDETAKPAPVAEKSERHPEKPALRADDSSAVQVAMAFDNPYIRYGFTAIESALKAARPETKFSFHILHEGGITKDNQLLGKALFTSERSCITFHNVAALFDQDKVLVKWNRTHATWHRIALPVILKDYQKVIYLDADILVRQDLSDMLAEMDDNKALGAVFDILAKRARELDMTITVADRQISLNTYDRDRLGITQADHYFNGGVLVFNMPKITQEQIDGLFELSTKPLWMLDQDALNSVFNREVCLLDYKWNFVNIPTEWGFRLANDPALPSEWRQHYVDAFLDPGVIHYVGTPNPWEDCEKRPYLDEYREILAITDEKMRLAAEGAPLPDSSPGAEQDLAEQAPEAGSDHIDADETVVAMTFDEAFARPGFAVLHSILASAPPQKKFAFHILYEKDSLSTRMIDQGKALFTTGRSKITFHDIGEIFRSHGLTFHDKFARATCRCLVIPCLFSESQSKSGYVVYLDCDVLVASDLSEITAEMDPAKPLGAVTDIETIRLYHQNKRIPAHQWNHLNCADYFHNILNMKEPGRYFNAGVLIFNIPQITKAHQEQIFALTRQTAFWQLDQDILNSVFNEDCMLLHERWNFTNPPLSWGQRYATDPNIPQSYRERYIEAFYNPHIIHYTASPKPWLDASDHQARLFMKEYEENLVALDAQLKNIENQNISAPDLLPPSPSSVSAGTNSDETVVAMAFDEAFARPGFAVLHSILASAAPGKKFSFHILYEKDSLSAGMMAQGKTLFTTERSNIVFHDVRKIFGSHDLTLREQFSRAAYHRLAIPIIFGEGQGKSRLDSDVLVISDLSRITAEMDSSKPLGAVPDILTTKCIDWNIHVPAKWGHKSRINYHRDILKLDDPYDYFNSGVLVFNIPEITEEQKKRLITLTRDSFYQLDQDILNIVFHKNWAKLAPGWNLPPLPQNEGSNANETEIRQSWRSQLVEGLNNPHIIHFANQPKPWNDDQKIRPFLKEYRENLARLDADLVDVKKLDSQESTISANGISDHLADDSPGPEDLIVVLSFDEAYARPGFTVIQSVLDSAAPEKKFAFHILHEKEALSEKTMKLGAALFTTGRSKIAFHDVSDYQFSCPTYHRMAIPLIFSDCQYVGYLDSDLLILGDLSEITAQIDPKSPLGAVPDAENIRNYHLDQPVNSPDWHHLTYGSYLRDILKMKEPGRYFNAGVLIFNIPRITQTQKERLITLSRETDFWQLDQDILNSVFNMDCTLLHERWNFLNPPAIWGRRYATETSISQMHRDRYLEAFHNPRIIHYTAGPKPWVQEPDREGRLFLKEYRKNLAKLDSRLQALEEQQDSVPEDSPPIAEPVTESDQESVMEVTMESVEESVTVDHLQETCETAAETGFDEALEVVLAFDENYARTGLAMLQSVLASAKDDRKFIFHILHEQGSVSAQTMERGNRFFNTERSKIVFHDVSAFFEPLDLKLRHQFSRAAYYCLAIPRIFSDRQYVIYLESDMLVLGDLSEMTAKMDPDKPLGVIPDIENIMNFRQNGRVPVPEWNHLRCADYFRDILKMEEPEHYFSAGALVFNIPKITEAQKEQLFDLTRAPAYWQLAQDILNAIFNKTCAFLDESWNFLNPPAIWDRRYATDTGIPQSRRNSYVDAFYNPRIIHFLGHPKPWLHTPDLEGRPFLSEYRDNLAKLDARINELEEEKARAAKNLAETPTQQEEDSAALSSQTGGNPAGMSADSAKNDAEPAKEEITEEARQTIRRDILPDMPEAQSGEIAIVMGFDNNHALPCFIVLQSVLASAATERKFAFHMLYEEEFTSTEMMERARILFSTERSRILFHNVSPIFSASSLVLYHKEARSACYRLAVPLIFDKQNHIIWLDHDVLAVSDMAELLTEMDPKKPLGAVPDFLVAQNLCRQGTMPAKWGEMDREAYHRTVLKMEAPYDYFSTAVLVFNIPEITEAQKEQLVALTSDPFAWPDQDILNIVFHKDYAKLAPGWNLPDIPTGHSPPLATDTNLLQSWRDHYADGLARPHVIHFTGRPKPWNDTDRKRPFLSNYREHLAWLNETIEKLPY